MRFAFVPIVILAASFSLIAAQTATPPPNVAPNKTDQMRPPPPPSNVNVLNFPEVQTVEGTVAINNLPAVQTVGGTVNVGNLPLDAEGAVRVAGGCPTTPPLQARYVDLLPGGPISLPYQGQFISAAVATAGFAHVGFTTKAADSGTTTRVKWGWVNESDWFAEISDARNGTPNTQSYSDCIWPETARNAICANSGAWVRLEVTNSSGPTIVINQLGVYLMP